MNNPDKEYTVKTAKTSEEVRKLIENGFEYVTEIDGTKLFRKRKCMHATEGERMRVRYRVHKFDIDMTKDQSKLEQFLNNLDGEVVAIIPSVNPKFTVRGAGATVDFLLIVEKSE